MRFVVGRTIVKAYINNAPQASLTVKKLSNLVQELKSFLPQKATAELLRPLKYCVNLVRVLFYTKLYKVSAARSDKHRSESGYFCIFFYTTCNLWTSDTLRLKSRTFSRLRLSLSGDAFSIPT